jgi:hypothetical protein
LFSRLLVCGSQLEKYLHEPHSLESHRLRPNFAVVFLTPAADLVETKGYDVGTPLHLEAQWGKTEIVESLLERWPEGVREKDG